jgi:hypothetical protein
MRANSADLPHLEISMARLDALLAQGLNLSKEQAVFQAGKQESTQQLQTVLVEGTRLATLLRNALKQHYGPTSEKLAEFGLKPFRGRKARQAPEPDPEVSTVSQVGAGPQVETGQ